MTTECRFQHLGGSLDLIRNDMGGNFYPNRRKKKWRAEKGFSEDYFWIKILVGKENFQLEPKRPLFWTGGFKSSRGKRLSQVGHDMMDVKGTTWHVEFCNPRRFGWIWVGKSNGARLWRNLRGIGERIWWKFYRQFRWGAVYMEHRFLQRRHVFLWGLVLLGHILTRPILESTMVGFGQMFRCYMTFWGYLTHLV